MGATRERLATSGLSAAIVDALVAREARFDLASHTDRTSLHRTLVAADLPILEAAFAFEARWVGSWCPMTTSA